MQNQEDKTLIQNNTDLVKLNSDLEEVASSQESETLPVKTSLLNRLMSLAGEMVLIRNQQIQLVSKLNSPEMRINTQKLDLVTSELQDCVMRTRMQSIESLFQKFEAIIKDTEIKLGKEIYLQILGKEVELDRTVLEALTEPLFHILKNACEHGLESTEERLKSGKKPIGRIQLNAWHENGQVIVEIADDGRGFDLETIKQRALSCGIKTEAELILLSPKEIASLVFLPGMNSSIDQNDVGMDVIRRNIEKVGGTITLNSAAGKGSTFQLQLPLTLAIIPCLIVRSDENKFAIPQVNLDELVTLYNKEVRDKIELSGKTEVYRLRNQLLPLIRLNEVMANAEPLTSDQMHGISRKHRQLQNRKYQVSQNNSGDKKIENKVLRQSQTFAVLKTGSFKYGLIVDEVIGTEEVVVSPMHPQLKGLGCYAGATIMGDGKVALILDVSGIANHCQSLSIFDDRIKEETELPDKKSDLESILIFRHGPKEQFAVSMSTISRLEKINMENIESVGGRNFITIDGKSTRILRLDHLLKVSEMTTQKEAFLLLPKGADNPGGFLISSIEDSVDCNLKVNTESYMEDGLRGSAIIKNKMTLLIDIERLLEIAE